MNLEYFYFNILYPITAFAIIIKLVIIPIIKHLLAKGGGNEK